MAHKVLSAALVVVMAAAAAAAPQYSYEPPAAPSNLYEIPAQSVDQPVNEYLPPLEAQPQNIVPEVVTPPTRPPTTPTPSTPAMKGMPYDFEWGVQDGDSGNAFSHVENSDGKTTQGEYRVLMADGRTQVVKFFDNGGGFNAVVTYEK
ncbi:cuticle protein 19-like [Eriocheir sinensis]|uniref:cuticle protein 19-like n=1 Tax=Eriocheir sinensis TaxID=95602 RepID=UPI0021C9456B|nr:cuticle protein 19-like [Eriocheir sinensis]